MEPPTSKKNRGFDYREKPPRNWLNWLFYWIYQWILWIDNTVHEERTTVFHAAVGQPSFTAAGTISSAIEYIDGIGLDSWRVNGTNGITVAFSIPVNVGDRIKSAGLWVQVASSTVSIRLDKTNLATGAVTLLGTATSSGTAKQLIEVTGLTELVSADFAYRLIFNSGGTGSVQLDCFGGRYTVDRLPS